MSNSPPKGAAGGGGAGPGTTPTSSSTTTAITDSNNNNTSTVMGGEEKARLTEEEKKQNHIASEQKRRQAIRDGFDRLANITPGMAGLGRSEAMVLRKTVDFMVAELRERKRLVEECDAKGIEVDVELRVALQQLEHWERHEIVKRANAVDSGNDSDDRRQGLGPKRKSTSR